jgi:LacI family transcriptional regulator
VLESIGRLGYVRDRIAASLRSRVSSTVGVIVTDIADPFVAETLAGLHRALNNKGYTVLLGTSFDSLEKQGELIETMAGYKIQGLALCPAAATAPSDLALIERAGLPAALFGRDLPYSSQSGFDHVIADTHAGAHLAIGHLAAAGHRRIAFLGGHGDTSTYQARVSGYQAALHAHGIEIDPSLALPGPPDFDFGAAIVGKMLEWPDPPTAAFCYDDAVAIGVIQGLRERNLAAGRDLAVVGFDDIRQATIANPALTTISVDTGCWGGIVSRLLAGRILNRDAPPEKVVIAPRLVVRDSSRFARRR